MHLNTIRTRQSALLLSAEKNLVAHFPKGSPLERGKYMDIIDGNWLTGKDKLLAAYGISSNQKWVFSATKVATTPYEDLGNLFFSR